MTGDGLPLQGIRVVDFTSNMAGPFSTQILADQGADVIKVEAPEGDRSRSLGSGAAGYSAFFANLNRAKRSITLDLDHPDAHEVVGPLLNGADVVVHSFRPGPSRRFRLDADQVLAQRSSLIHTTITGFGSVGPFAGRPAYDQIIQALAGFAAAQSDPDDPTPTLIRQGVVDKVVGQTAAQAITAALFQRARTGTGQAVEVRMLDAALAFLWPDVMMNHTVAEPTVTRPSITRSFRLTRTSDGQLAFALVTTRQYQRLAEALEMVDGAANPARLLRAAGRHLAALTTAEGVDFLSSFDVPVAPVTHLDTLHEHPQVRASGLLDEHHHPVLGRVRQPGPAVRFGARPSHAVGAPRLGEHTDEVAGEIGLQPADISRLRSAGVFGH